MGFLCQNNLLKFYINENNYETSIYCHIKDILNYILNNDINDSSNKELTKKTERFLIWYLKAEITNDDENTIKKKNTQLDNKIIETESKVYEYMEKIRDYLNKNVSDNDVKMKYIQEILNNLSTDPEDLFYEATVLNIQKNHSIKDESLDFDTNIYKPFLDIVKQKILGQSQNDQNKKYYAEIINLFQKLQLKARNNLDKILNLIQNLIYQKANEGKKVNIDYLKQLYYSNYLMKENIFILNYQLDMIKDNRNNPPYFENIQNIIEAKINFGKSKSFDETEKTINENLEGIVNIVNQ